MSSICADLLNIVDVVNDFQNFLGPELKAVTGDIDGIDLVIQVYFCVIHRTLIYSFKPDSLNHDTQRKFREV
jgi:hypothetical protein